MIEINLIPDVKQELIRAQRTRTTVITGSIIAGIVGVGVVVLLAVYVFGAQALRSTLADDEINKAGEQLTSVEDLSKVLTIQNQLAQIDFLNQTKREDSRVFEMLEAVLPPPPNEVRVSNLALDAEGKRMVIEGQTSSYDTLEIFKKTIEGAVVTYTQDEEDVAEDLASEISIGDISYGEDSSGSRVLRFTISFLYPDSLFAASIPTIVIKLTNAGNVTDSYLGVPRSIFVEGGEIE